jgi:hypothetical protein
VALDKELSMDIKKSVPTLPVIVFRPKVKVIAVPLVRMQRAAQN